MTKTPSFHAPHGPTRTPISGRPVAESVLTNSQHVQGASTWKWRDANLLVTDSRPNSLNLHGYGVHTRNPIAPVLEIGTVVNPEAASRQGFPRIPSSSIWNVCASLVMRLWQSTEPGFRSRWQHRCWTSTSRTQLCMTNSTGRAVFVRTEAGNDSCLFPRAGADQGRGELKRNDAAFFLERLGQHNTETIEWRTTTIRGDRYCFVADWSSNEGGGLQLHAQV